MRSKSFSEHIKLVEISNHKQQIIIDDYELYDLIDDILTERYDISPLHGKSENKEVIYLNNNSTYDQLDVILSQLDLNEIERIFNLNN